MNVALGLGWAVLVLAAAASLAAPPPARHLAGRISPQPSAGPVEWVGRVAVSRLPRTLAAMPAASAGRAVVALVVGSILALPVGLGLAGASLAATVASRAGAIRRRRRALERVLPDAVDLLRLAVASGLSVRAAVITVADVVPGEVGAVLARAAGRLAGGDALAAATRALVDDLGPDGRRLGALLLAADQEGGSMAAELAGLAADLRRRRADRALARAGRLPVLLLFPLVTCVLPAFALLSVVPLVVGGLADLSGP